MIRILLLVFFIPEAIEAQQPEQILTGKNFYVISVVNKYPEIRWLLPKSRKFDSTIDAFRFSPADSLTFTDSLELIFDRDSALINSFVNAELRLPGNYNLFIHQTNKQLWLNAWGLYFTGINHIIDQYGLGRNLRYPAIDSSSYYVRSSYYQTMLNSLLVYHRPKLDSAKYFFENPLTVALALLELNGRDEAARHEPLEAGENKAALKKIRQTDFLKYFYSAIVVPGDGPAISGIPLAPMSVLRCKMAAEKYRKKLAPFIILSGGYCHPFQTKYAEAVEMKKYLISELKIPEYAIIIDPHARHTTTNFRNAGRYLIRYVFPINRPALLVTTNEQADYIMHPKFDERNIKELGYLPYINKTRISAQEIEFKTVPQVLHRDPRDPLDP